MEGGGKRKEIEQYSGYDAPNQGADTRLVDDAGPSDGASKNVRAREQHQEEHKHEARQLVAESAAHEAHGVGVVLNMRILQLDLADDIAGIDGDQSEAHGHDDARHHSQAGEGARHAEGA